MTELNQLLSREQTLNDQIKTWGAELRILRQQIADLSCPFKIGDIVNDGTRNYQVAFIDPYDGWRKTRYTLRGRQIKKDGTPGKVVYAIWREVTLIKKAGE